jgi:3beta-hydroxy-delta5-steroid dehydrogenase/steroid delta-isomerase
MERIPLELDLPILRGYEGESTSETSELGYCLVTGGAGYLGRNIAFELLRRGATVRIFDRKKIDFSHDRLDFVSGDIREYEDVRKACEGIETVFHTAAVMNFLGLATRAQRDESFAVNVGGVANMVRACEEAGVKRLIHTSTNNVTFGGPLLDGDESSPYAEDPKDLYTESKILGEKAALEANGRGGLLTCAIRPGGIYGPGDQLLLARVAEECARGMFVATFGDGTAKSDNSFIGNLVDGQIEAARHLVPGSPVCGQAYFITDGVPINYFDFFRPFVEGMGFEHPRMRLPTAPLYAVAAVWEFLHWTIKIPPPMFTRLEVRKMTVSHYSRIDKARRDFGWEPKVSMEEATEDCIAYCRDLLSRRERVDRPHWGWWADRAPFWEFSFPNSRWLLAVITVLHRWLYLWTNGRIGHGSGKRRFLLLNHIGRKTGRKRVTPLLYVRDGERWIVVASNAGDERDPAWWLNLQSLPKARIQLRDRHLSVKARRASQEECELLWPRLIDAYRTFASYRTRTRREIPIVILEAAGTPSG